MKLRRPGELPDPSEIRKVVAETLASEQRTYDHLKAKHQIRDETDRAWWRGLLKGIELVGERLDKRAAERGEP